MQYSILIVAAVAACIEGQIMKFGNCPDVKLQENFEPATVSTPTKHCNFTSRFSKLKKGNSLYCGNHQGDFVNNQ